jgi:hypothetical protein
MTTPMVRTEEDQKPKAAAVTCRTNTTCGGGGVVWPRGFYRRVLAVIASSLPSRGRFGVPPQRGRPVFRDDGGFRSQDWPLATLSSGSHRRLSADVRGVAMHDAVRAALGVAKQAYLSSEPTAAQCAPSRVRGGSNRASPGHHPSSRPGLRALLPARRGAHRSSRAQRALH